MGFALILIAIMIFIITILLLNRQHHNQYQGELSAVKDSKMYVKSIRGREALALPLLMVIIRFIFRTTILYVSSYIAKVIRDGLLKLELMLCIEGVAVGMMAYSSGPHLTGRRHKCPGHNEDYGLHNLLSPLLHWILSLFMLENSIGTLFLAMDNVPKVGVISRTRAANLAMSLIESTSTLLSIVSPFIDLYVWVNIAPRAIFLISLLMIIPSIVKLSHKTPNVESG